MIAKRKKRLVVKTRFVAMRHYLPRFGGLTTLALSIFFASLSLAQSSSGPAAPGFESSRGEPANNNQSFPCDSTNSKVLPPGQPRSKHVVTLSWNASVSLSSPLAPDEGYNVYRLNPNRSCTKLNDKPVRDTTMVDSAVELGNDYGYAVTALKQNSESKTSVPVTASIPPN